MKKLLVLIAAIALVGAFALPAAAGDWSFYGSARMATFFTSQDEDAGDDAGLAWAQQGNSRIGASVKGGDVTGGFEYGTGVNMRELYGQWNYGGGTLLVGQTYVPLNFWVSSQTYGGDAGLLDVGGVYGGRHGMIMLKTAGIQIAAIEPSTADLGTGGDIDVTLPKIEARWGTSFGPGFLDIAAGYQSYKIETAAADYDVNSYVVGVMGGANFGAAYVKANFYTGTNAGQYGLWQEGADDAVISGTDVENCATTGILVVGGFKASETMALELGVGQNSHTVDVTGMDDPDTTMAYYVQANITLADGFYIVPEVGAYDYAKSNTDADQGTMTYFGAKWQMNF